MAKIDVSRYIEQSGMRKARFGGYEPEDVRQAMLALCGEYEQNLARAEEAARSAAQEGEALRRRCETLLAQNQTLNSQNATLAGKVDEVVRRQGGMGDQLDKLKERNHSLADQCAVLRLKNADLARENEELKEQAAQADAALRIKGRAHDQARAELEQSRGSILEDAKAEAEKIVQQAHGEAAQIVQEADLRAQAVDRLAREQATEQARNMVRAATDEIAEIQNASALRLQDLRRQVEAMERYEQELLEHLTQNAEKLQALHTEIRESAPEPVPESVLPTEPPEPLLDLSERMVAAAANALREAHEQEEAQPLPRTNDVVEPGPQDAETPRGGIVLLPGDEDEDEPSPEYFDTVPPRQPAPQSEVPGAIFSYPIVRQQDEPILDEEPPLRGPHAPVMPSVADEDEETDPPESDRLEPALHNARRRKALAAVRALHRRNAKR